jgi:hypothetical protein
MGAQLPFVLRRIDDHHTLIGETYIHGIMDGEALAVGDAAICNFEIS